MRSSLCAEAREAARSIGERLLEELQLPDAFDANLERFANRTLNGPPGFALAFLALTVAFGDARYEAEMHRQLRRATRAEDEPGIGLFTGISGLRAVAQLATMVEPRYAPLVAQCDAYVDAALNRRKAGISTYLDYDLYGGWSGARLARCVGEPAGDDVLTQRLAWIAESDSHWKCAHPLEPQGPLQHNLGMAHGIPGVLSALTLTVRTLDHQLPAHIAASARWLIERRRQTDGAAVWPRTPCESPDIPNRSVWCYGTPGVCISLLQCAQRIGDPEVEAFAVGALAATARRPRDRWEMTEAGICHGTVGNALIFSIAAQRTGEPLFERVSEELVEATLAQLAQGEGRILTRGFDGVRYDAIGELNGVAGIATALLTLSGDFDARWLLLHGLAPNN